MALAGVRLRGAMNLPIITQSHAGYTQKSLGKGDNTRESALLRDFMSLQFGLRQQNLGPLDPTRVISWHTLRFRYLLNPRSSVRRLIPASCATSPELIGSGKRSQMKRSARAIRASGTARMLVLIRATTPWGGSKQVPTAPTLHPSSCPTIAPHRSRCGPNRCRCWTKEPECNGKPSGRCRNPALQLHPARSRPHRRMPAARTPPSRRM